VTLAVTGNTISSRVFRRYKVTVFQRHRLLLTGPRRDIRWVSYSGKTPTFCVFPVFSVAVMEKCCDACGVGEYYFRSGLTSTQSAGIPEASTAVDQKSTGIRLVSYSGKTPTFCVFPVFRVAVMETCCQLAVTGNTISSRVFRRYKVTVFLRLRLPWTRSRRGLRFMGYSVKTPTYCVTPVFSVAVMEKCCDACGDGEYYFRSGFSVQNGSVSEASTVHDRKSMGTYVW
jgi:hypothetical protein